LTPSSSSPATRPIWFQMWRGPRSGVRRAVTEGAVWGALWVAVASGMVQSFMSGADKHVGTRATAATIVVVAMAVGAVWGLVQLALLATLLYVVGRWTNSRAHFGQLCTALGWAQVPLSAALPLWLIGTLVLGRVLYIDPQEVEWSGAAGPLLVALVFLGTAACAIWSWILMVKAVAEIEGVKSWTAFGHIILALTCLGVAVMLVAFGVMFAARVARG